MDFCLIVVCAFIYFNYLWNENEVPYIEVHHVIICNIFTKAYTGFQKENMWCEKNMSCEKNICENMFSSVQSLSHVWLFATHGLQHARLPCPLPTPGACSNSCSSSWWCHPTISSYVIPSPPAFSLSQHQGLFQRVGSLHQVTKVLELQLQHQSFQWIFRVDFR